jgi:hypothetical protein
MTALLLLVSALAVLLAFLWTAWCLLVLPFSMTGAFRAWLGLSNQDLFDAFDGEGADADPGRGPAGLTY